MEMKFSRGESVEISMKEDGFHGSYYVAKILSKLKHNVYLIEYTTLLHDDETHLLKDIVHADKIRPLPPVLQGVSDFSMYDKVDVYDNDGWWAGLITGRQGLMYHVYFPTTREVAAYPQYRLRLSQDWVDGMWVVCGNNYKEVK